MFELKNQLIKLRFKVPYPFVLINICDFKLLLTFSSFNIEIKYFHLKNWFK